MFRTRQYGTRGQHSLLYRGHQVYFGGGKAAGARRYPRTPSSTEFNPLALELDIYSLAHHLCTM
jgi:hypothetical protein